MGLNTTPELAAATRASDVCVTCTPSREAFLRPEHVRPGTFVAAVGRPRGRHARRLERLIGHWRAAAIRARGEALLRDLEGAR